MNSKLIKVSVGTLVVVVVGIFAFGVLFFVSGGWKGHGTIYEPIKIGYFHGGRTMLLFRSYLNGEFDKSGMEVKFFTKDLQQDTFYQISEDASDNIAGLHFGRVRGGELIDEVIEGHFDAATVGESSFIKAASEGKPIVAVAMLGHDQRDAPAHAILVRKGIVISEPSDFKGMTLSSRRAGDGDATFLKQFLTELGLDPEKDVQIVEQTQDVAWMNGLVDGIFDAGYYHQMAVRALVESGNAYIYRRLDWVDPEMSQALLVFHKDYVARHPDKVYKFLKVYAQRIKYEQSLPVEKRNEFIAGMQMEDYFQGMNLPQYTYPPLVSTDLLQKMKVLLEDHGVKLGRVSIVDHIDNSFVNKIIDENKD